MIHSTKNKWKSRLLMLIGIGTMALYSCKKDSFLDVDNASAVDNATAFSTAAAADLVLNDIYNNQPDGYADYNFDPMENWSDNALCAYSWPVSSLALRDKATINASFDLGGVNGGSYPGNFSWGKLYSNIRKCNVFIAGVEASELEDDYKKQRIAEARILRAYAYHWLWILYGGVPIIDKPDNRTTDGDAIFHPRATAEETFKFIDDEFAAAASALPDNSGNSGGGRVNKGTALALKGWVELYHASPLRNPTNDISRWAAAAATSKLVMDLGYELHPSYPDLFYSSGKVNNEGIFYIQHLANIRPSKISGFVGPKDLNGRGFGWGNASAPTHELVEDYGMMDGSAINDPGTSFDPNNPYANRDPRLAQSIVYNENTFNGVTILTYLGAPGKNGIDFAEEPTPTGYSWKKAIDTTVDIFNGSLSSQNYYLFRYAEVLLNYAEAQNEAVGPDETVYAAIKAIRKRAGIIAGVGDFYGLPPAASQAQMRDIIHRERRVELAFEGKRYVDLLRWKIAEQKLNGNLHGMYITKTGSTYTYEAKNARVVGGEKWTFDAAKNYLFPIPVSVIGRNTAMQGQQNPGYQ